MQKFMLKMVTSEYEVTSYFTTSDLSEITCNDLKGIENVAITKDSKIVVRYSATLNKNAKYGTQGNPNEVSLGYCNNPNYEGAGKDSPTGETPKDAVIVFTYKLDANKVEPDGENATKPLKGAERIYTFQNCSGNRYGNNYGRANWKRSKGRRNDNFLLAGTGCWKVCFKRDNDTGRI